MSSTSATGVTLQRVVGTNSQTGKTEIGQGLYINGTLWGVAVDPERVNTQGLKGLTLQGWTFSEGVEAVTNEVSGPESTNAASDAQHPPASTNTTSEGAA